MPLNALHSAAIQDDIIRRYMGPTKRQTLSLRQRQLLKWSKSMKQDKREQVEEDKILTNYTESLAERLGLVPRRYLSSSEWSFVKSKCISRNDPTCPICQSEFKTTPQILLSCSHIFHQPCFLSFQKLVTKRACPVCRCEGYEMMTTYAGKHQYLHSCATMIQKTWRGYKSRKEYREYLDEHGPRHPLLKQKYVFEKLKMLNCGLVDEIQRDRDTVSRVMELMNQTSLYSQQILQ